MEPRRQKKLWLTAALLSLSYSTSLAADDVSQGTEEALEQVDREPDGLTREEPADSPKTEADSTVSEAKPHADPLEPIDTALRSTALLFFQALIAGVPEAIAELADYPFNLDGKTVEDRADLANKLQVAFRSSDLSRLPFFGMRVFPAERMIERHGPPPRRLEGLDLADAWVAIANLGGHAYIGIFQKRDGAWRVIAYTE